MSGIVELDDADGLAEVVLKETLLDGHETPPARLMASRWGAPVHVARRRRRSFRGAEWVRLKHDYRIYVHDDDADPYWIAHELGHVAIDRWQLRVQGDEERWCNRFGAALLAPSNAIRQAWRGRLRPILNLWAHVPQTAIALRVGESRCAPIWIVEGQSVRYAVGGAVDNAPWDRRSMRTELIDGVKRLAMLET